KTPEKMLDDARDSAMAKMGATLEKQEDFTVDGNPARSCYYTATSEGTETYSRFDYIIVKPALYQVAFRSEDRRVGIERHEQVLKCMEFTREISRTRRRRRRCSMTHATARWQRWGPRWRSRKTSPSMETLHAPATSQQPRREPRSIHDSIISSSSLHSIRLH